MASNLDESSPKNDIPTKDLALDTASNHSASTTLSDLIDFDIDPGFLLSNITSLLTTLEDTVSSLAALRLQSFTPITEELSSACHDLFKKLCELEGVVGSYVAIKGTDLRGEQIPLDPMLYKWAADLMMCLLGLHAELEEELVLKNVSALSIAESKGTLVDEDDGNSMADTLAIIDRDDYESPSLKGYLAEINTFLTRIKGALPVIQADFGTYHTSHLNIPGSSSGKKSSFTPPDSLNFGIKLLRRTLYELKDALSDLDTHIKEAHTRGAIAAKTVQSLDEIQATTKKTAAVLSTYLTNDGSDWLDSLLSGNLSFLQFRLIDAKIIRKTKEELVLWMDYLKIMSIRAQNAREDSGGAAPAELELAEEDLAKASRLLKELGRILKV